ATDRFLLLTNPPVGPLRAGRVRSRHPPERGASHDENLERRPGRRARPERGAAARRPTARVQRPAPQRDQARPVAARHPPAPRPGPPSRDSELHANLSAVGWLRGADRPALAPRPALSVSRPGTPGEVVGLGDLPALQPVARVMLRPPAAGAGRVRILPASWLH